MPILTDKELWENGCLTRAQLATWTDGDFKSHPLGLRKTLEFLFERHDALETALAFAAETYQRMGDELGYAQTVHAKEALIAAQNKARGKEIEMRDVTPLDVALAAIAAA